MLESTAENAAAHQPETHIVTRRLNVHIRGNLAGFQKAGQAAASWAPVNGKAGEVFGVGDALLAAVAELPAGQVRVRTHVDREGRPAFRSVHFARPHQLVYRGDFEVQWR